MRNWRQSAMIGVLIVLAGTVCAFRAGQMIEQGRWDPAPEAPEVIHEDSPEWDCATMGNRLCGPLAAQITDDGYIGIMECRAFSTVPGQTSVCIEQGREVATIPPEHVEVGS